MSRGEDDLVVIYGPNSEQAANGDAALRSSGTLGSRTSDPKYISCNYYLSDNAASQALGREVAARFVADGLATSTQLNAPSTTWMITDDPTDRQNLFVAAILATKSVGSPDAALTPIVASVDRSTATITNTAVSAWYAGQ